MDTSALITIAASSELRDAVRHAIGDDPVVLMDAVVHELKMLAGDGGLGMLAAAAGADLGWLGPPVEWRRYVQEDAVREAQARIADGRALKHDREHWAESVIVAMCEAAALRADEAATPVRPVLLVSEDHAARIEASKVPGATARSLHRLFWEMVGDRLMTADDAARLAELIRDAGRGNEYTREDFADRTGKRLGRVGRPW